MSIANRQWAVRYDNWRMPLRARAAQGSPPILLLRRCFEFRRSCVHQCYESCIPTDLKLSHDSAAPNCVQFDADSRPVGRCFVGVLQTLCLCTGKCITIGFHTVPRVEGQNSCVFFKFNAFGIGGTVMQVMEFLSGWGLNNLGVFRWLSFALRKLDVCKPWWLWRWASVHACICPPQDSMNSMYPTFRRTALYWRAEQHQEVLFGDSINQWCRGGGSFLP